MNPEEPVCTCLTVPIPLTGLRIVKVFDPYCQLQAHKDAGTYTGPEPVYEKAKATTSNDYACRECGNSVLYRSDHKPECKHYPGGSA